MSKTFEDYNDTLMNLVNNAPSEKRSKILEMVVEFQSMVISYLPQNIDNLARNF